MLTANSEAGLKAHIDLGARPKSQRVIANGIDTQRFRPDPVTREKIRRDLGIASDAVLIAHVARVDPMKDHSMFLAAMRLVPGARAILIGRGTEALLDLPPNVLALGQRDDVPALLAAADIIASSSAYGEGFSNALAEGMAAGLPAVATDAGDAGLILGDTGALCPPGDPQALAAQLKTLLDEPDARFRARAAAARKRIEENFSLARAVVEFTCAYRALLGLARLDHTGTAP